MPNTREKLIELQLQADSADNISENTTEHRGFIADFMISNGVTVQEWIPVTERLPERSGKYLVCTNRGNVYQTKFYSYPEETGGHWGQKDKGKSITHWMPLPSTEGLE